MKLVEKNLQSPPTITVLFALTLLTDTQINSGETRHINKTKTQKMKKITLSLLGLAIGVSAFGQENVNQLPAQLSKLDQDAVVKRQLQSTTSTEAVIWSEDFANGIPATWSNQGFDGNLNPLATAVWEYRGTSTTPDNSQGTRGAYGAANDPILSTTASNGFVIFDSDYLDNGGIQGNEGNGTAPAPHVGTLTTGTIDLTGHPYVMLELQSYARVFYANFQIAISTDGGTTWTDTITSYSDVSLGVNGQSLNADLLQYNLSSQLGNQSNVKLRFIFDGRPGNANGNSYYFWILDDIRIADLPRHSLRFVDNNDGAPAHDMIYGTTQGGSKYGIMTLKQARAISFDSNILNFGWDTQTNVQLEVRVLDGNQNVVQTLNSSAVTLNAGDTADYTVMNTSSWNPTIEDNYQIVYIAKSDSVNGTVAPMPMDTFRIYVTDSLMSLDFNRFNNRFGTTDIGPDGSALAVRMELEQDERLFGADIWLSATSVAGGVIEVTVYDSTGFDFTNGFPSSPLAYYQHTVTATDISNGVIRADLTGTDGYPVYLSTANTGAYYIVVTMFSNADANPVNIRNDQSFPQPSTSALMYYTLSSPRWYTGFQNSLDLNAPHIRAVLCPAATASACMTISIDEQDLNNEISVYPNPATDYVNLEFGDVNGAVDIRVVDLNGRVIVEQSETAIAGTSLPVSLVDLTPGVYVLSVQKGDAVSTFKLTVQ